MKILDLEKSIINGQKEEEKTYELYKLLSSYNAYCFLLLKAQSQLKNETTNINYINSDCFKDQIPCLFSTFESNECLKLSHLENKEKDILFLINQNTILRINYYDNMNTIIDDVSHISYSFLRFSDLIARTYNKKVYNRNPYYCEEYYEDKNAFGLYSNGLLITPNYELDDSLKQFNNMDITDILTPQSLDEIYYKITDAKKEKSLILTR